MRIGELLIGAKLVTPQQVEAAQQRQAREGGDLGSMLVTMGAIEASTLERLLRISPLEPTSLAQLQIKESDLLDLLLKLILVQGLESSPQFIAAIKLPQPLVKELADLAITRQLLRVTSARGSGSLAEQRYQLTEAGREWADAALERSHYVGPAPVSLDAFKEHILLQRITNERVTLQELKAALSGLCFDEDFIRKIGPAINSGRPILFYGPPGNGKTTVAVSMGRILSKVTYVPYAVMIEGQIMRVFDSKLHAVLRDSHRTEGAIVRSLRDQDFDERWIPCQQPFVVAGGELTMEMLELAYDPISKFYEAPLHVKALGGSILIDDFGRQLVSPAGLLNRWIVPLENGYDFLKLHTGRTFELPFEVRVMFSTNLEPNDLMDSAFLRRIPFKLEVGPPTREQFKTIFATAAKKREIPVTDDILEFVVRELIEIRSIEIAAYQPEFIVQQVVLTCEFEGEAANFEPRFIESAIGNIQIKRYQPAKPAV
jgi:energy-coupling factor transporter ATP-binding protein EcfA2